MQAKTRKRNSWSQKRNDVSRNVSTATDPETPRREKDKGKPIDADVT